jgi:hypothetical protein
MHLNMANSYTSIKVVADRLLRHPLMAGISFEAILDYTVDFLRIVQCYGFFEEKCVILDVVDYRSQLPDDFYEMYQVRLKSSTLKVPKYKEVIVKDAGGNEYPSQFIQDKNDPYDTIQITSTNNTFRYSTDSFHMSEDKCSIDLTYKIQGGIIYTSIKEGQIEISYQALVLDNEGYPVIPDNSKFLRALEAYIKKQWFTILFDMGKLQSAIYQNAQQDYAWAVGACESEFQKMTLDKAESFFNSWNTLLIRKREHSRGFATNGMRENLKLV